MNWFHEKAQAFTRQTVGQMIGDDKLVLEAQEQQRHAEEQRKALAKHPTDGESPSKG